MWYDKFISYIGRRGMFPIWIHTKEEVKRLLILGAGGFGHMIQEQQDCWGTKRLCF